MKKRILLLINLLAISSILFVACKKENNDDRLKGTWEQKENQFINRLEFGPGQKFSMSLTYTDGSASIQNGNFSTKGDSLFVSVSEMVEKKANGEIVKTPVDYSLFDKATYSVRGSKLTLRHISYPADAPVITEMIYSEVDLID